MTAVSIGIPFTDQTQELSLAITSVLQQSYKDWELILLGDGPSPAASAMAKSFDDPRIRLYEQPVRQGLAATLNQIAQLARHALLARMDGDDMMHPLRIERQVREFASRPLLDVLGTNAYLIDESTQLVGAFVEPELPLTARGFLQSNAFSHPTVMARTSWFRANPYDDRLLRAQDKELWLRTFERSEFHKLPDRLLFYRVPRKMSPPQLRRNESYNRKILHRYLQLEPSPTARALHVAQSLCKQALFSAAGWAVVSSYLYDRKWTELSEPELRDAAFQLDLMSTT